jgi:hypothetical protein
MLEETKSKLSIAMMGNKNRLGYICTDKTKRKMSAATRRFHKQRRLRDKPLHNS